MIFQMKLQNNKSVYKYHLKEICLNKVYKAYKLLLLKKELLIFYQLFLKKKYILPFYFNKLNFN